MSTVPRAHLSENTNQQEEVVASVIFEHIEANHRFTCDDRTGLLTSVSSLAPGFGRTVNVALSFAIETGGKEQRGATGGLDYSGTNIIDEIRVAGIPRKNESRNGMAWCLPISFGGYRGELHYQLNRFGPSFSASLHVDGNQDVVVRNIRFAANLTMEDGAWSVTAPGNCLAAQTPLPLIVKPIGVSAIGGLRGSSGLIHLQDGASPDGSGSLALWVDDETEIPDIEIVATSNNSLSLHVTTNFSADLSSDQSNDVHLFSLDHSVSSWVGFPALFDGWLRSRALTSPGQPPTWVLGACIYEAQVGFSVFNEVHHYSPYPELGDLINDLDRIKSLGFSVIQLMPRQPYPSYNVHDYWDIETSYGPVELVKALVHQSHERGIRIILDVLLHGVLDQESIQAAADGVRSGPFGSLVATETGDSFGTDVNDWNNYLIAWSRHILDFEPYWKSGSPPVSPLIESHPNWFLTDSGGNVAGVYTKAFDARNREWQEYFTSAMSFLMTELDIDGFRFDAPTYNDFPNWATWARGRASTSQLACLGLFERLRPVLKSIKSDALMYTEPSGHSLRRSMDLNYNYDEQWLLTALASGGGVPTGVSSGKGLAKWMRDRDALLPHGSVTAHHIDSHDTFWWPTWGKKWRREQFTMDQVRLLTFIFAGLPGPFMMFSGGEVGIEDLLPAMSALKTDDLWCHGVVSWGCGDDTPESVFSITRSKATSSVTLLANVGTNDVSFAPSELSPFAITLLAVGPLTTVASGVVTLGANSGVVLTVA